MTFQLTHKSLAVLVLSVVVVGATVGAIALGALSSSRSIQSQGTIKAVNVGVYWNSGCTNATSVVNWGMLSPGTSSNATVYVRNEGNVVVRLSLTTSDWNPTNAPDYITMSWNRGAQTVNAGAVVTAVLTLSVSSSITGITSFSFDIVITGTEQ